MSPSAESIDWAALLGSVTTVVGLVAFVAIVLWAYSRRRKTSFDAASRAPFALPDESAAKRSGEGS